MQKSQYEKENRWKNECRAPKKNDNYAENYTRKISRAPLGGIQSAVGSNQHLCVPEQKTQFQTSKSTSENDRRSATTTRCSLSNRFSPAILQNQRSPTQQCSIQPTINQPLRCPPISITVRSKSVLQHIDENHILSSTHVQHQNVGSRAFCGCPLRNSGTNRDAIRKENAKQLYKTLEIGKYIQEMNLQQDLSSNNKNYTVTQEQDYNRSSGVHILSGNKTSQCQSTSQYGGNSTQQSSIQRTAPSVCRNQTQNTKSTITSNDYATFNDTRNSTISTTVAYNIDELSTNYNENSAENTVTSRIDELTQNRKISNIRNSLLASNDSISFVDGNRFFKEEPDIATRTDSISPLMFDLPIPRNINSGVFSACLRRPNVKNSLKNRSSLSNQYKKELFYVWEYAEDIIQYLKAIEQNLLVHPIAVEQLVNKAVRSKYVHELMRVIQIRTPNNDPVYFMALRIFDWTIVNLKLRDKNYKLAAMISFWIASKYLTNAEIKATKIYTMCSGSSTKIQILSMEVTIIKKLQFNLNMADPLDFLNYYLRALHFERDQHLRNSAHFIIECSTLCESYMITKPSFLAAAALSLAYKMLCQTEELFYKFEWHQTEKLQKYAYTVLADNIKYSFLMKYEPVQKYGTIEKLNVVQYFVNV